MKRVFIIWLGALCIIMAGCAKPHFTERSWQDDSVHRVWPPAPSPPRVKLLRTLSDLESLGPEGDASKVFSWITGGVVETLEVVSPYAVVADGKGRVWLTDGGLSGVHVFDLPRREISFWSSMASRPFILPLGLAYDEARERVYVSDAQAAQIFALTVDGDPVEGWRGPSGLSRPVGLAVDSQGNLFVVDAGRNVVEVYSPGGDHLKTLDSASSSFGAMNRPTNVAVNSLGEAMVVDSMGFRVLVFTPDGKVKQSIGELGDAPGKFARPKGIAVDSEDHAYVTDAAFDNVQIFDMAGNSLLYFGSAGSAPGYFSLPAGIFIDSNDRIYAVDTQNKRVQVFQYLSQP